MEKIDITSLRVEFENKIAQAKELKDLDLIFNEFLAKQDGKITAILRTLKDLPSDERATVGARANELNVFVRQEIYRKTQEIKLAVKKSCKKIDITRPGVRLKSGHIHPITQVLKKSQEIFESMGFSVIDGPEMESEWYNFDALNIPKDHPARDKWDTFWLEGLNINKERLLLRTHTSPVQVRHMEKINPPFRIIVPGRTFRHEATDASHEFDFNQIEGLMVGEDISVANLKVVITEFLKKFFNRDVKIRLRPSFFPFTEPSFEIDMSCLNCGGVGCSVCKQSGWVEIMGAGMVHPNVFKNAKLDPKQWQGFAFGVGADRLALMKYKINDIRLFKQNDLRFLEQF